MNNTIILGFPDERALGKPSVIVGPDEDRIKSINVFEQAKRLHRYPKDVKCLVAFRLEEYDRAIFMGESVGDHLEAAQKRNAEQAAVFATQKKANSELAQKIDAARTVMQLAARTRNELMGKLYKAENDLKNNDSTPEHLRGKLYAKTVKELQSLILGDPDAKVAGLKQQVEDAKAAYETAAADYQQLLPAATEAAPVSQMAAMIA